MIPGTDVSTWQDVIRFGDAQWVAERVSTSFGMDSRNNQHRLEIVARKLPRLAYHAAYPGDGARQAGDILAYAGDALGLAFDGREFGALDQEAKDFFAFLDRNDPFNRPTWQYQDYQHPFNQNGQKHAWRAAWGSTCPAGLNVGDIWQNAASGPGFNGDHDQAIGTAAEWAATLGGGSPTVAATDITFGAINLVKADYSHAILLAKGAKILTPEGAPRSTAKGGETLAYIGADGSYYLVTDGGTLAIVKRDALASVITPSDPIHIAASN